MEEAEAKREVSSSNRRIIDLKPGKMYALNLFNGRSISFSPTSPHPFLHLFSPYLPPPLSLLLPVSFCPLCYYHLTRRHRETSPSVSPRTSSPRQGRRSSLKSMISPRDSPSSSPLSPRKPKLKRWCVLKQTTIHEKTMACLVLSICSFPSLAVSRFFLSSPNFLFLLALRQYFLCS